jgi:hypothetical protein
MRCWTGGAGESSNEVEFETNLIRLSTESHHFHTTFMSLFTFQLDVGATSLFLFEKAVALRSYWLNQGVAGPGWNGLVSSIQSLQIAKSAARNANKRVKRIQAETKSIGEWVMGVRKGDMIEVLNEHEPTWSIVALLLPITAVLGSQDAADVLVALSAQGCGKNLPGSGALVKQTSTEELDKPMDFETAHNIIIATTPYVGIGYELQAYSAMLKAVLQAFDGKANNRIAEACKWRPSSNDIVSLLQQISRAGAQADTSIHIVVVTDKGIDVLCWLAATLFECRVDLSVDGETKTVARGPGVLVTVAASSPGQSGPETYSYANARLGIPGNEGQKEAKQWDIFETRWMLSDYIRLRSTSWAFSKDAQDELNNFIVDSFLSFWFHSHIRGSLGSEYSEGLKSAQMDHRLSGEPAAGPPIKDLFSIDTVIDRIRSFDPFFADIVAFRASMECPIWSTKESTYASTNITTFAPYCPCGRHKGQLASPSIFHKHCVIERLHDLSRFGFRALFTLLFVSAPHSVVGVPLNCSLAVQKLVNRVPSGLNRGEQLHLSHILEAAVLLLGNNSLASQASAQGVIGLNAYGVSIIPNALVTTSVLPAENLTLIASPGALYCRGVEVSSVRDSEWARTGLLAFGGPPIIPEKISVVPADKYELAVLESESSRSQVLVEASVKGSAGYVAFRISWMMNGEEVNEYVSLLDVLYGMTDVPYVTCTHPPDSQPSSSHNIMLSNAASCVLSSIDGYNFRDHSYAKSKGIQVSDCLGGFDGVVVAGMKDRGHLLRAIRYIRNKVRMGDSCLECALKFATDCKECEMVITE